MTALDLPVKLDHQRIASFCEERGITRLRLFGSVLRDDFRPGISDIDVIADFESGALGKAGWHSFAYADELAEIVGHPVDLLTPVEISPFYRDEVLAEALTIYERP